MNVALAVDCLTSEGPGRRFGLWTQGCPHRCPGCGNRQWWSLLGGVVVPAGEIVLAVAAARAVWGLEGITVSGGEPFLQSDLVHVLRGCQALGLSVIVFTGYFREELGELSQIDVLIDGPYKRERPEQDRNLVGSTNQRFHYLTDRYNAAIEISDPRVTPHDFEMPGQGQCLWRRYPSLERV